MRKSAKLCLYGVVIAGVVGGTAAWATTDKAITVSIDGQSHTIHTRAGTVAGALKSAHIGLTDHDAVAPALSAQARDHGTIVVRKGRLLHLNVDGKKLDVWTTAGTVDEALDALGYVSNKTVSVSRSTRLPLSATHLTLLTPKRVTIKADGRTRTLVTTVPTVHAALIADGIKLGRNDRIQINKVSIPGSVATKDKQVIVVVRVRVTTGVEVQPIPFPTNSTNDATALEGTTTVVTPGKAGAQQVTFQYVYVDGKLYGKHVMGTKIATSPVPQVEKVGTKKPPAVAAAPAPVGAATPPASTGSSGGPTPVGEAQTIAQQMVTARGWGGDQFGCLVDLWNRESGWNTHAANSSGAYGIPQALPGEKMSSAGPDWQNNATTQISWGLGYISGRYGTPCGAWAHSESNGWY